MNVCIKCAEEITPPARAKIAKTCLKCGELDAKEARRGWTVCPLSKSNYVLITNHEELKQLNPKRTVV